VYEFDSSSDIFSGLKRFESEHWFCYSLHGSMILFHDIIEVFDLMNHYRDINASIDHIDCCFIGVLSIETFPGTPLACIVLPKKRLAAALSRLAFNRECFTSLSAAR